VVVGLGGEIQPTFSQRLRQAGLDPSIQVEAVVQEEAKGQEASRETVVRTNGSEVGIISDEEKKQ
jgi:hypothetical protein